MKVVVVFLATVVLDAIWAGYISATARGYALRAASYSALIVLLGAVTTLALVDDPRYVVPAACGAFFGTLLTVRR